MYTSGAVLSETQTLSIQPFELEQVIISTGEDSTTQRTSITYGYTTILNHQSHPISYPTAQSADSGSDVLVKYSEKIHKPLRDTLWPDRPFVNKDTALASDLSSSIGGGSGSSSGDSKNSEVNFKHLRQGITSSSTSYNSESEVVPLIMWSDNIHSSDTITYYTNTTKPRRISDTAIEQYRILNIPPHHLTTGTLDDSSNKGHNYDSCYKRLIGSEDGKIDYSNITGDTRQCIYPYNNAYFCGYTLCNTHTPPTADAYTLPTTYTTNNNYNTNASKDGSYTTHSDSDYSIIHEANDTTALLGRPYLLSGESASGDSDGDSESVSILLPVSMTQASSDAKYIHIFETLLLRIQQQYYTMTRLSPTGRYT